MKIRINLLEVVQNSTSGTFLAVFGEKTREVIYWDRLRDNTACRLNISVVDVLLAFVLPRIFYLVIRDVQL